MLGFTFLKKTQTKNPENIVKISSRLTEKTLPTQLEFLCSNQWLLNQMLENLKKNLRKNQAKYKKQAKLRLAMTSRVNMLF